MKRWLRRILHSYFEDKYINPDISLRKEMFYRDIANWIWEWEV